MENRLYGKLDDKGNLIYAQKSVKINGNIILHPSFADYALLDFYPIVDEEPSDIPEGKHAEAVGWEKVNCEIRRKYEIIDNPPPPPRKWTRFALKTALADSNLLSSVKTILSSINVKPELSLWESLDTCDYIKEGYPDQETWDNMLDKIAQELGKTREDVDAFLDNTPPEVVF